MTKPVFIYGRFRRERLLLEEIYMRYGIRLRNKLKQRLYRPNRPPVIFSKKTLAVLDELEQAIDKKITPLLSGLWKE